MSESPGVRSSIEKEDRMDRRQPEPDESRLLILENSHLTEDALELYSLGRLQDESALDTVEQHLLVCAHCQTRLERADQFQLAAKAACKKAQREDSQPQSRRIHPLAIAAALAAILLVPASLRNFPSTAEPFALELSATRAETKAEAPTGSPLRLHLNLNGMETANLTCNLVSMSGETLASGGLNPQTATFESKPLAAGQYLLRLTDSSTGQVKREFLFQVRSN